VIKMELLKSKDPAPYPAPPIRPPIQGPFRKWLDGRRVVEVDLDELEKIATAQDNWFREYRENRAADRQELKRQNELLKEQIQESREQLQSGQSSLNQRQNDMLKNGADQVGLLSALRQRLREDAAERLEYQRLLREQRRIDQAQNRGFIQTLRDQFGLVRWLLIGLLILTGLALFAGQGWATRVLATILKLFVQTGRLFIKVGGDAITNPIEKTEGIEDAVDNLRDEISDAVNEQETEKQ